MTGMGKNKTKQKNKNRKQKTNKQTKNPKNTHSSFSVDLSSGLFKLDVWKSSKLNTAGSATILTKLVMS